MFLRCTRRINSLILWSATYYFTTLTILLLSTYVGSRLVPSLGYSYHDIRAELRDFDYSGSAVDYFLNWDAIWYEQIASVGYSYSKETPSNVAFFPIYPMTAKACAWLTGIPVRFSLLIVSHLCLFVSFALLKRYAEERFPNDRKFPHFVLVSFAIWPTTMFFRMGYSEAMFFMLTLFALFGMKRRWPCLVIATIVGAATGVRTVGVAVTIVFIFWLIKNRVLRKTNENIVAQAASAPLACWGILAYMLYQYVAFGEPFAFIKTQDNWTVRNVESLGEKIHALITFEPVWSVYVPDSAAFWKINEHVACPLVSLKFANPIFFVLTCVLILVGSIRKWLNAEELLLSVLLTAIPYIAHSYEGLMYSQARYMSVVVPMYLVLGRLLRRAPRWFRIVAVGVCLFYFALYTALFTNWYKVF